MSARYALLNVVHVSVVTMVSIATSNHYRCTTRRAAARTSQVEQRMRDYAPWLADARHSTRPAAAGWPAGQCTDYVAQERRVMIVSGPPARSGIDSLDRSLWRLGLLPSARRAGLTSILPLGQVGLYRRAHAHQQRRGASLQPGGPGPRPDGFGTTKPHRVHQASSQKTASALVVLGSAETVGRCDCGS